jgi:hypothetical protein
MLYNFPPSFELIGEVKTVDRKEPTETKKTPAMKLFVQYGSRRTGDGKKEVNFLNGMFVRVPFFVHQRIGDKIVPGTVVHIKGHLQGVYKMALESVSIEAVAERISFARIEEDEAAPAAAPAAAE